MLCYIILSYLILSYIVLLVQESAGDAGAAPAADGPWRRLALVQRAAFQRRICKADVKLLTVVKYLSDI